MTSKPVVKTERCTGRFGVLAYGCVCIECGRKATILNALRTEEPSEEYRQGTLMRKIISLFQRNYDGDRLVRDEVVPGAEWVIAGEGTATQKLDGTSCLVRDGKLYRRHELKAMNAVVPEGWEATGPRDPVTQKQPGWAPVGDEPSSRWHREAWEYLLAVYRQFSSVPAHHIPPDGTYELLGPKIQGNPEGYLRHALIQHGAITLRDVPRDFEGVRKYLSTHDIEGIVWWRDIDDPDCDKVKIKAKDFGIKRGEKVRAGANA